MDSSCTRYKAELSALVDGQLETTAKEALETHLSACIDCGNELESVRALSKFMSAGMSAEKLEVPDLWESLKDSLPSICQLMEEDLSAYLDGELSAAAQEGVNRHLKECQTCLASFRNLNAANRLIATGLELPTDAKVDLWSAIKSRLNEDCVIIEGELSAFADQEVVQARHRAITAHLMDCQNCRERFNELSAVGDVIRESYKPVLADDFDLWPDIKRKLQVVPIAAKQKQKQSNIPTRYRIAAVAAAIVGLTGLVSVVWLSQGREESIRPMTSEAYLIESALTEPADIAEAVLYEQR